MRGVLMGRSEEGWFDGCLGSWGGHSESGCRAAGGFISEDTCRLIMFSTTTRSSRRASSRPNVALKISKLSNDRKLNEEKAA